MPKIYLKPNSPEFADSETGSAHKVCDMHGCSEHAEHKAPKHRGLNEYHHFCLDHVREYNKAWNFFDGMSDREVQDHMTSAMYGDRPTWRYDTDAGSTENLRRAAWRMYQFTDEDPATASDRMHGPAMRQQTPEYEAMAIMGLEPPLTFSAIKERYKELAKQHHPDLNQGCTESEERLKKINMAYTLLKVAYEEFEKLPDREKA